MTQPIKLSVGYATTGQGAGPVIVTEKAGLFLEQGLDVTTHLLHGARGVVAGLMGGTIQFGNLAAPALLKSVLVDGADVAFLTGGINQQFLMGRPGVDRREQLANGGKIGLMEDGGLNDLLVYFIVDEFKKAGIDGVQLVALSGEDKLDPLTTGKCDALIVTPPECIVAKRLGCHYLVDFGDYGLNFALGGIAARRAYVQEHPEIAEKFVTAYLKGMKLYKTDREFTVTVQQQYSQLSDRSVAEETYDLTAPGMPMVPYPDPKALATALTILAKKLPQAAAVDPSTFIDDQFLRRLATGR